MPVFHFWLLTFLEFHLEGKLLWCGLIVLKNFNLVLCHSSSSIFGSLILFLYFLSIHLTSFQAHIFLHLSNKGNKLKQITRESLKFLYFWGLLCGAMKWTHMGFGAFFSPDWLLNKQATHEQSALQTCANCLFGPTFSLLVMWFLLDSPGSIWLNVFGKLRIIILQNRQSYS